MTRTEIITALRSAAQQSRDAARASEAGTAVHRTEWAKLQLTTPRNEAVQDRIEELYSYIFYWPRESARLRREAETFDAAADLLQETTWEPSFAGPRP